jgi:hypothetical protein
MVDRAVLRSHPENDFGITRSRYLFCVGGHRMMIHNISQNITRAHKVTENASDSHRGLSNLSSPD